MRGLAIGCALVGAALTLASREARACKCGYDGTPIAAPTIAGEGVVLKEEEVALRCDRAPRFHLVCAWSASYRLHNAGAAQAVEIAVTHVEGARVRLALAGQTTAESRGTDVAPRREARRGEAATRTRWTAAADAEVALTVEARFFVAPWGCTCADGGSNYRRHPWVSMGTHRSYYVNYGPGAGWAATPATIAVTHDIPRRWSGDRELTYSRRGDRKLAASREVRPTSDRWDEHGRFDVHRRWRVDPGGPIVAAGLGWGPEGLRPRLRAGYELAYPRVLAHSLAVETDATRRVMLVPAWELTIPDGWPVFYPDIGAGLGVPIEVVPAARPGVRVHGRFGFWIFHLIGSFDHFPALAGLPVQRLGSLLLQVGF